MEMPSDEAQSLIEFLYACPVGLVEIDGAGTITMMNPHAMKHLLPMAGERDVTNLFSILERSAPDLRNMFDAHEKGRGTICEGQRIQVDLGRGRGGAEPKMLSCTLVRLRPDRAIATFVDITQQVAQERRLRQAETWFASLLDGVNDFAVLSVSADGCIEAANASFPRQTGMAVEHVVGRYLDEVVTVDAQSGELMCADQLRLAERDGWCLTEGWQPRTDGDRYWCQRLVAARVAEGEAGVSGFTVVLRDVVRQQGDSAELRRMLTRDHLTGAANRAHFFRIAEREQARWQVDGRPFSLVMIDVDHFKAVNDVHGHPVGDRLLRGLTEVCQAALRPGDLFARLGGEEFGVLLPNTDIGRAVLLAERLRGQVAALRIDTPAGPLAVTASLGCADVARAGPTIEALVAAADSALYAAKRSGRNRVCRYAALMEVGAA